MLLWSCETIWKKHHPLLWERISSSEQVRLHAPVVATCATATTTDTMSTGAEAITT